MTDYILANHWDSWASVIGLIVAIIGFAITIINVYRSKKAAEQAEEAVTKIRDKILTFDKFGDINTAITILNEIKRLVREKKWDIIIEKIPPLKQTLVSIKGLTPELSKDHKRNILGVIQQLTILEQEIEKTISNKESVSDIPRINRILTKQIDRMTELLVEIQKNISR